MEDLVLVGRIARAHGNKGQVIVNTDTDFPDERFRPGEVMLVGAAATPRTIRDVRFQQGRPIVTFDGVESMDDAEALAGSELWIPSDRQEPLPPGTFYHHDLIGCEVRDSKAGVIGRVTAVEGTMEMSRLVVEGPDLEVLIPLVAEICTSIDTTAREVSVTVPDGLIELNETAKKPGRR
ncbi:MAG: 16S rRNA processing protein RimM [Acidobacteria bacterium]|nr:16S rRNA processing protein RimM [Acidobacteriota bacterium]